MPRKKKQDDKEAQKQAILALRYIAKDKESPAWARLAAIDRLAVIDNLYSVGISPIDGRFQRVSKVVEQEEVVVVQEPVLDEDKELLDSFNRKHFNGGKGGDKPATTVPTNSVSSS